jgi:ABC-type transport auxiliary lipoprotein component
MKSRFARGRHLALSSQLSALTLLLAGCSLLPEPQVDPVRHFTLSGAAAGAPVADAMMVRPVRLAGHLRNRSMAVRVSENEVVYLDDIRWAEPLDEALTQVLRNRLRQIGGGAAVTVSVQRCELVRSAGNSVQLTATYAITPAGGEPRPGEFTASARTWDGGDAGDLVGLLQAAANELADAIAAAAEAK